MLSAKKEADADPGFKVNNQPLTKEKANSRAFLLPFYVGTRVFTLFIYLVFILVFIGMHKVPASGMVSSVEIIFFKNDFMRISFGIIVLYYLADFLTYRWSGLNEETTMKELAVPFDGRSIVMHVVIVLGAVSTAFLGERLFGSEQKAAPILFAGFFVVVKTLVDLFAAKAKMEREEMVWRKIWNKE